MIGGVTGAGRTGGDGAGSTVGDPRNGAADGAGPPRVVVVGDVAVDVLVTPFRALVPGADVPAAITMRGGGAGANTAVWLAHLLVDVTLVSRIGDDLAGRAAAADLPGVTPVLAVDPGAPTCSVVVLVADDDRTMLSDRGAAARLSPTDLPDLSVLPAVGGFDHLHLSGYVLLDASSRPAGLAALAAARAAGLTTSVDPQAAPMLNPEFLAWVRGVDLLLPNADELAALGGESAVLDAGIGAVAATAGAAGASWTDRSGHWRAEARAAQVVDATGAGDAFDAGLLAAWLTGAGPAGALRAGCRAAAAAVGCRGGRPRQVRR